MTAKRKTLTDIRGDTSWTEAEQRVIDEAPAGEVILGDTYPDEKGTAPEVRAALIRHIVLGGSEELPLLERSIAVKGARITGLLDLEGVESPRELRLARCRLEQRPRLTDAKLGGVYLTGCALPGLDAQRLRCDKNLFLDSGFHTIGTVYLAGATVGGQLAWRRALWRHPRARRCMAMPCKRTEKSFCRAGFTPRTRPT